MLVNKSKDLYTYSALRHYLSITTIHNRGFIKYTPASSPVTCNPGQTIIKI